MNLELSSSDPSIVHRYLKAGFFKEVVPLTDNKDYPFKREYECMTKNHGFRENTRSDAKITAAYMKRYAKGQDKDAAALKEGKSNYLRALRKYPQCLRSLAHASEMPEVMSDMLGTIVAEKFLTENPPQSDLDRVGYLPMSVNSCAQGKVAGIPKNLKVPPQMFATSAFKALQDSHASDRIRIEKIYLNLPGIASVFGCRRRLPKCFDHLSIAGQSKKLILDKNREAESAN